MGIENNLPDVVRQSYVRKFLLAALVVVVVVAGLGVYTQSQVSADITDQQRRNLLTSAELESNTMGQWMLGQTSTTRTLSQHAGLAGGNESTARSVLVEERSRMPPEIAALHYLNYENGTVAASTTTTLEGADVNATNIVWANQKPFSEVSFADPNSVVQSWVYSDDGEPSVALASRVPDTDYVLVMVIRTNKRADRFESSIAGTRTTVVGRGTGDILFDRNKSRVFEKYGDDESGIRAAMEENQNGTLLTEDAVIAYTGVTQEDSNWVVIKKVPKSSALAVRDQIGQQLLLLIAVALFGLVALGVMVSRGPMRSLRTLSEQATAIANGDLSSEIEDENRIDEVGRVRSAFREIKAYLDVVADQADALARQDFEDDSLDEEVPGRLGESLSRMRTDLEQFIRDLEETREQSERSREEAEQLAESLERQAEQFGEVMTKAAAGDLTQRLDTETDNEAMRDIAVQSNEMLSQLEQTVVRIEEFADQVDTSSETVAVSADEVRSTSEQVSTAIQEIADGAEEQNENVEQVADEMTDLSATVEEIASSADEVAEMSQTAAETGEAGRDQAANAAAEMDAIKQKAEDTIAEVERLDSEMEQIGDVVELIDDIADQTNILALNASIEAAHAGETSGGSDAGDGFAVVADEIKDLAEETQDATDEIEQMIAEIQDSTERSVADMQEMGERIDSGRETVANATEALEEIVEQVTAVNDGIQPISDATDEQASSTEEVVAMTDEVRSVSEETAAQAENAAAAAEEQTASVTEIGQNIRSLSDSASELRALVAEFETSDSVQTATDRSAGDTFGAPSAED